MVFNTISEAKKYRRENGMSYTHTIGQVAVGNKVKWSLFRKGD